MAEIEAIEHRLDEHAQQDHDNFTSIRQTLERMDVKLDEISEKTVRLEVIHDAAAKSGAISGSRWSAIIAIAVSGVFQACQWISGYSSHP